VYVAPASRGQNVGKALVQQLLELASGHFRVVRLSTDTPEGAAFYLRCGFQPIHAEHATHMKSLVEIT
ncbi:GNAT family N-acetyltransferase, partial [Pseudomonas jessenii]